MAANPELVKEKVKADKEIKKEIAKIAAIVAALSFQYKSLGYGFAFNANDDLRQSVNKEFGELRENLFGLIQDRAAKVAEISTAENTKLYGLDKQMSPEEIEDFLLSEIEGKTTKDRIELYSGQVKGELEAYIATGLVYGLSYTKIGQSFVGELLSPYSSKMMMNAMNSGLFEAVRLRRGELNYGSGRYASGFKNLLRTDFDVTQRVFIKNTIFGFLGNSKIQGYVPRRNSIVSCEICDSLAGKVFPMDTIVIPAHPRCICSCEPVLADGSEFRKSDF